MTADGYFRPSVTVDCVVFNWFADRLHILLIQREKAPFAGHWALPGGFIEPEETLLASARRELEEETQLKLVELFQLGCYGDPGRDPRGRTLTIAFLGWCEDQNLQVQGQDDAHDARWFHLENLPDLAFDHQQIIQDARHQLKAMCLELFPGSKFKFKPETEIALRNLLQA